MILCALCLMASPLLSSGPATCRASNARCCPPTRQRSSFLKIGNCFGSSHYHPPKNTAGLGRHLLISRRKQPKALSRRVDFNHLELEGYNSYSIGKECIVGSEHVCRHGPFSDAERPRGVFLLRRAGRKTT